LSFLA
jgi:hypothetical protein